MRRALAGLLPAVVLLIVLPVSQAAEDAAAAPAESRELTPEEKARVAYIDGLLVRFEGLLEEIDDAKVREDTRVVLNGLKAQCDALRRNFDLGRYEALRLDANTESQRIAMWLAPPETPPPSKGPVR